MDGELNLIKVCTDKYCGERKFTSYFIRKDEGIFKSGFKNIWFRIDINSRSNCRDDFVLLKSVIEIKRELRIDCVYLEIDGDMLSYYPFHFSTQTENKFIFFR